MKSIRRLKKTTAIAILALLVVLAGLVVIDLFSEKSESVETKKQSSAPSPGSLDKQKTAAVSSTEDKITTVVVLVIICLSLLFVILVPFRVAIWVRETARHKRWFSAVVEGTGQIFVSGDGVEKIVIQLKGHTLDKDYNIVPKGESGRRWWERSPIFAWIIKQFIMEGIYWLGIPGVKEVFRYRFRWSSLESGATADPKVKSSDETIDYFSLKRDTYVVLLKAAEDKHRLPLDILLLVTLRICNPYKAIYKVQSWLEATLNRLLPPVREYVANTDWETLQHQSEKAMREFLEGHSETIREILDKYGVEVCNVQMVQVDISGSEEGRQKLVEASLKPWQAGLEAKAAAIKAGGEYNATLTAANATAQQVRITSEARVDAINRVAGAVKKQEETATILEALDALKVVGGGDGNVVIVPGSVLEVVRSLLGSKGKGGANSA